MALLGIAALLVAGVLAFPIVLALIAAILLTLSSPVLALAWIIWGGCGG